MYKKIGIKIIIIIIKLKKIGLQKKIKKKIVVNFKKNVKVENCQNQNLEKTNGQIYKLTSLNMKTTLTCVRFSPKIHNELNVEFFL